MTCVTGRRNLSNVEIPDDIKPANSHVPLNTVLDENGLQRCSTTHPPKPVNAISPPPVYPSPRTTDRPVTEYRHFEEELGP